MALRKEAEKVAAEFDFSAADLQRGVEEFRREMNEGLAKSGATLSQIPSFVTGIPNGTEKGLYMAVDLGGTNFRVCSIHLNGDTTFSLTQNKVAIPRELMTAASSQELFAFLAQQIEKFLKDHHGEHFEATMQRRRTDSAPEGREEEIFHLGFTFSFPVNQISINQGRLIRWTKGFDIPDAIGKDVCALLQAEIDRLKLPVKVAALVNDTVGTLLARAYTSESKDRTLIGAIFGTGTNGAYVEQVSRISKLSLAEGSSRGQTNGIGSAAASSHEMIINTEWGSFDNDLRVLPNTRYDAELDRESNNPGIQMFEKRVSGMFLGEILRRALLHLMQHPSAPAAKLFSDETSASNDGHGCTTVDQSASLYRQWGIDTSLLSMVQDDTSSTLQLVRQTLERDVGVDAPSLEDAEAVKILVGAIGRRAARLSAIALAGVVLESGRLQTDAVVDVGVDGSLVEYYPGFEGHIRQAFREIPEIGRAGDEKIRIGIAKDGSGVGAALSALVAAHGPH